MVLRADGSYGGVPAVIDKDLTSALLATEMGADALLILTAVPRIAIDFRKPQQRDLETVTASDLLAYQNEGQFAEGSMGPKVKAALRYMAAGGKRAIIAHLDQAADALAGQAGTHVVVG
jgi:carbamate kinase